MASERIVRSEPSETDHQVPMTKALARLCSRRSRTELPVGATNGDMKARRTIVVALVFGIAAVVAIPEASSGSALRKFSFTGAGTNLVIIQTGELRELWTGHANPFGKITAHVAGRVQRPTPTSLAVRSSMVI